MTSCQKKEFKSTLGWLISDLQLTQYKTRKNWYFLLVLCVYTQMQSPFAPKLLGELGAEWPGLAEIGFESQLKHLSLIGYSTNSFYTQGKEKNKKQSYWWCWEEKRNCLRDKYRHSTWEVGAQSQLLQLWQYRNVTNLNSEFIHAVNSFSEVPRFISKTFCVYLNITVPTTEGDLRLLEMNH